LLFSLLACDTLLAYRLVIKFDAKPAVKSAIGGVA
jgi:hypothetical protein